MKLKIYSILLLLAFLAALSHEVIPHHHHDLEEYGEENHLSKKEAKHSHNFPFHHHLSADEDFDYFRINFNKDIHATFSIVAELSSTSKAITSPPPEVDLVRFTDKPFLITTVFKPGAIGLRAPPSIA